MAKRKKVIPVDKDESKDFIGNTEKDYGIKEPEKEETAFNKQLAEEEKVREEQEKKLPIDKLIDIASEKGLFPEDLTPDQKFTRFIQGIKLNDIIYDCMQSSLNEYCKEYNKHSKENLKLKLHLRKETRNKVAAFSCNLVLEMRRNGLYSTLLSQNVSFTHIREVRDEAAWKYALYGAMYNALIMNSINQLILTADVKSGRIKPANT